MFKGFIRGVQKCNSLQLFKYQTLWTFCKRYENVTFLKLTVSKSTMYVLWCRSLIQCLIVSFSVPVNEVENNQNIRFILIVFFVFLGAFTALTIILRVIRRKTCKPIIMKGICYEFRQFGSNFRTLCMHLLNLQCLISSCMTLHLKKTTTE